jgi:hypothetical protein
MPAQPSITLQQPQATPFTVVTVGSAALGPDLDGTVRLSDGLGYDVTLPLSASEPIEFVCPVYFTAVGPTAGNVQLTVRVGSQSFDVIGPLHVEALPSSTLTPGSVFTTAIDALYAKRVLNAEADTRHALQGTSLDVDATVAAVQGLADLITSLRATSHSVLDGTTAEVALGSHAGGSVPIALVIDSATLSLLDCLTLHLLRRVNSLASANLRVGSLATQDGVDDLADAAALPTTVDSTLSLDPAMKFLMRTSAAGLANTLRALRGSNPLAVPRAVVAGLVSFAVFWMASEYWMVGDRIHRWRTSDKESLQEVQESIEAIRSMVDGDVSSELEIWGEDFNPAPAPPPPAQPAPQPGSSIKDLTIAPPDEIPALAQVHEAAGQDQLNMHVLRYVAGTYCGTNGNNLTISAGPDGGGSYADNFTSGTGPIWTNSSVDYYQITDPRRTGSGWVKKNGSGAGYSWGGPVGGGNSFNKCN